MEKNCWVVRRKVSNKKLKVGQDEMDEEPREIRGPTSHPATGKLVLHESLDVFDFFFSLGEKEVN